MWSTRSTNESCSIDTCSTKATFVSLCELVPSFQMITRPTRGPATLSISLSARLWSRTPSRSRWRLQLQRSLGQLPWHRCRSTLSSLTASFHRWAPKLKSTMRCSISSQASSMATMSASFPMDRREVAKLTPWALTVWAARTKASRASYLELFTRSWLPSIPTSKQYVSQSRRSTVTKCATCSTRPT